MVEANRKLAAILSADVAGYSRLMGADEEATVAALNACRNIFKDEIKSRQGRVVDTAGDSVLAEFPSVVEAVRTAVQVQQALAQRNEGLPEDRRMEFRIGVNLGDVIIQDDGTIYGEGVNVAARLEGLAEPGGINFPAPRSIRWTASSTGDSNIWARKTSRISPGRCGFTGRTWMPAKPDRSRRLPQLSRIGHPLQCWHSRT